MSLLEHIGAESFAKRRGATAVEFAMVLPVFLVFTFACFEFGRYLTLYNSAQNAAYEAARVVMGHGATAQGGLDAANALLQSIGATGTTLTMDPQTVTNETKKVTVTVQIPFNSNAYLPPVFAEDAIITGACTLACEGYRATKARKDQSEDDISNDEFDEEDLGNGKGSGNGKGKGNGK